MQSSQLGLSQFKAFTPRASRFPPSTPAHGKSTQELRHDEASTFFCYRGTGVRPHQHRHCGHQHESLRSDLTDSILDALNLKHQKLSELGRQQRAQIVAKIEELRKEAEQYSQDGNKQKALATLKKMVQFATSVYDDTHPKSTEVTYLLGLGQYDSGLYRDALQSFYKAKVALKSRLSQLYQKRDRIGDNNKLSKQFKKLLTEQESMDADLSISIGNTYLAMGEYQKALQQYTECFSILENLYKERDRPEYTALLMNIGLTHFNMGNYDEAMSYYKRAASLCEGMLGSDQTVSAKVYANMGVLYEAMGDRSQALRCFEKALLLMKKVYDDYHPEVIQLYRNIALLYFKMDLIKNATKYFELVYECGKQTFGENHELVIEAMYYLGICYAKDRRYAASLKMYRKCEKTIRQGEEVNQEELDDLQERIHELQQQLNISKHQAKAQLRNAYLKSPHHRKHMMYEDLKEVVDEEEKEENPLQFYLSHRGSIIKEPEFWKKRMENGFPHALVHPHSHHSHEHARCRSCFKVFREDPEGVKLTESLRDTKSQKEHWKQKVKLFLMEDNAYIDGDGFAWTREDRVHNPKVTILASPAAKTPTHHKRFTPRKSAHFTR